MVKYKSIVSAIEDYVVKCAISQKEIRRQIEPFIKELADSPQEYETLLKYLPRFYQHHYHKDKEYLQMVDWDNNDYFSEGTEEQVEVPNEAKDVASFLMSVHNHPIGVSVIPSDGDFEEMQKTDVKFMVTVGDEGLVVSKNFSDKKISYVSTLRLYVGQENMWRKTVESIESTAEFRELESRCKHDGEYVSKEKEGEFLEGLDKLTYKDRVANRDEYLRLLKQPLDFEFLPYPKTPVDIQFIPIEK